MAKGFNIFVTGGAGYLGSTLVPMLLANGHRVTVLDNFMFKQNSLPHVCHDPGFEVVREDSRNEAVVKRQLAKADVVIPLAALVGAPLCNADQTGAVSTNLDAVRMLCRLAAPAQRILLPNTNSGYGVGTKHAFCTEDSPLNPITLYGRTKVDAEKAVMERENSLSFRLATVFGMSPRMRVDLLVNDFVHRAVYDRAVTLFEAQFKRNYIHVRDVARAFLHGIDNFEAMKGQSYNVGLSDANLSKAELCERIQRQLPKFVFLEAPVGEDPDKRDYIVSNAKIEATGYAPAHSLDAGILELIKGFTMIRNGQYWNL